ncbi:MAG: hypothetical protein PHG94_08130 [Syntrophomonas sp.]|uniref:hypothetical protein n=1 Tax=Syntrophomonas sp. TaxID=2053627 RepID=UPI0026204D81|nr:hypothetical protein [Syntrophomonas sp.]MDD2511074.1 hypothetical protein [Syntrophomonas sp.]MDD4627406.1 hypothetical protein [Syntrophomonas sp.]
MGKAKIFVRERRKVEQGEKKSRFNVVGVAGTDLKIYSNHIRKMEIEHIAQEIDGEVVYLQAGKDEELDDEED